MGCQLCKLWRKWLRDIESALYRGQCPWVKCYAIYAAFALRVWTYSVYLNSGSCGGYPEKHDGLRIYMFAKAHTHKIHILIFLSVHVKSYARYCSLLYDERVWSQNTYPIDSQPGYVTRCNLFAATAALPIILSYVEGPFPVTWISCIGPVWIVDEPCDAFTHVLQGCFTSTEKSCYCSSNRLIVPVSMKTTSADII